MKNSIKYIAFLFLTIVVLASCTESPDTYEDIDARMKYSSKINNLTGEIGIEKVVLHWNNPQDKVSRKIRIEYGEDKFIDTESMVSSYTITDLTLGGGYDFTVYTIDEYGNKSIGASIFLVPHTREYVQSFVDGVTTLKPTSLMEDDKLILQWSNLLSNAFLRYTGTIDYKYTLNDINYNERTVSDNSNQEAITINDINSPVVIDLEYTMYYQPIINNNLVMDTIAKTESVQITVEYPSDNVQERVDRSRFTQMTNIPFDNTTQHSSGYNFYNMFDGDINSIWISARPDNDPVNGGNAQNNYEYPVSFTIDLGRETILSELEFTGWEDYSQAPQTFEIWGSNEIKEEQPDSYWATTIPGEWQSDWKKLADCDTDNFNRPSIKYEINPDKHRVRYVRFLIHEIYKIDVQWDGVYIRIAIGELIFYRQPGMIAKITF